MDGSPGAIERTLQKLVNAARYLDRHIAARMGYRANGWFDEQDVRQDAVLECIAAVKEGKTIGFPVAYARKAAERRLIRNQKAHRKGATAMDDADMEKRSCREAIEKFRMDGKEEFLKFQLKLLIASLSERDRTILELVMEGFTSLQIAVQMSTTEGAINAKLTKIRRTLRQSLEQK